MYLSHTDVRAVSVHVWVVGQQDVQGRLCVLRNHAAAVARLDNMGDVAVLANDAEAQRLRGKSDQRLQNKTAAKLMTSPSARLSHAASILSAFTVSSWKL